MLLPGDRLVFEDMAITYGVVRGLLAARIGGVGVVQLDAHADLRDSYRGDPLSHACVMRRIVEAGIPLYQLGVRAICAEEAAARERHGVGFVDADVLVPRGISQIRLPSGFPEQVYVTLDVDGLDPSVIPATGTPVPGGPGWYQTLSLLESVARQRRLIGFDLMELAPIAGLHCYDFAAAYFYSGVIFFLFLIIMRSINSSLSTINSQVLLRS
jgi:agmatinase